MQDKTNRAAVNVSAIVEVLSFDPRRMRVDVEPLSKYLEGGEYKSQPPILDVPVTYTKMGGYIIRPWIKKGDIGHVIYVDHDIDRVAFTGEEEIPNTERNHSASDAMFIGGIVIGNNPMEGLPDDAVCISTDDAVVYIAVRQDEIILITKNRETGANTYNLSLNGLNGLMNLAVQDFNIGTTIFNIGIDAASGILSASAIHATKGAETINALIDGKNAIASIKTKNIDSDKESLDMSIDGDKGRIKVKTNNYIEDKTVLEYDLYGPDGDISLEIINHETDKKTVDAKVDGQNGAILVQTFDKDDGSITGTFRLP